MESQRLDLGPNRWIAAGGLAFIYVRAWRGWVTQITVAPVRDTMVGRATLFGVPARPVTDSIVAAAVILIGMLCFPGTLFALFSGELKPGDWTIPAILFAIPAAIFLNRLWRRGRLVIHSFDDQFSFPHRIYFSATQEVDPRVPVFCDYLKALKSEAGDGRRRARCFVLTPCWVYVASGAALFVAIGSAHYIGLRNLGFGDPVAYCALVGQLVLFTILLLAAPERNLLFDKDLRKAHSNLLAGDAKGVANILHPILDVNPNHRFANYLMTIVRLMQCDLKLAEDLVIQQYNPRPDLPSRYHRIMDTRLWGSRHDD